MIDPAHFRQLTVTYDGPVAVITLNRPERRNAADDLMHTDLSTVFAAVDADADTRVAVLTGAGSAFCIGGDLAPTRTFAPAGPLSAFQEARLIVESIAQMTTPLIAAVNGDAIGLGAILATLADTAFVAESATIGDGHVSNGATSGNGAAVLWPLIVGLNRAKYLLFGSERLTAAEAARLGLVHEVVADGTALDAALELAKRWAGQPRFALESTKRVLNLHLLAACNTALATGLMLEQQAMGSPEFKELLPERRRAFTAQIDGSEA